MTKKPIRILIAEDDPFLIKVAGITLESKGYEVDRATTGKEALEKIRADGYKLILLDLIMPEIDGFEVLETLKRDKIKTPVIVFSNLSQEEDKKEALQLGAKDFYIKSNITLDELASIVTKYLK